MGGLLQNYIANFTWFSFCELIGTITGFLVLYYQVKQKAVMWNLNVISATFLGINFFVNEVYAYAFFQIYYIVTSIYGLYVWLHGKVSDDEDMPIQQFGMKLWIFSLVISALLFASLWYILGKTGSKMACIDAFITAMSIVATFLLAKKYIEQWYFWLASDCVYITSIIYFEQTGMYVSFILYSCYIISAFVGIYVWWKKIKQQRKNLNVNG